jgi:glycerol-3-phosphate dehydrogenase subunit C
VTITYDPAHPKYFDEPDLRAEMDRVFEICQGCRMCFNYCGSFPKLFEFVDRKGLGRAELSEAEQDRVVDECFQCKICYVKCPYVPPHEWMLDFPRLMMRANAVRTSKGGGDVRSLVTDQILARTDLVGKFATLVPDLVNSNVVKPDTVARKAMETLAGISSQRLLPSYTKERFSSWFGRRTKKAEQRAARALLFPSCFMEYNQPDIGKALVSVYEHFGVECSLPDGIKCCGAPWLHQGHVAQFMQQAADNVAVLAKAVKRGENVVVAQPTCGYVLKRDYPLYLATEEAKQVGEHTYDASEYLVKLARDGSISLDDIAADVDVTYHAACHLQAQNAGLKGRDLLKMLGAKVRVVAKCSGIDGTWGYRKENEESSLKMARALAKQIEPQEAGYVCGDCHLANTAICEQTGLDVLHPIQVAAKMIGLE